MGAHCGGGSSGATLKELETPLAADLRLAHCAFSLPDGKRRATLAGVPIKRMEALEKMLDAADCRPVSISLALGGCFSEGPSALHFLANGTHTDIAVTSGGGIAALRCLAGAGPSEDAPFDAVAFGREIRITLGRLPESVRQEVRRAAFGGTPDSARQLAAAVEGPLRKMGIEVVPTGQGEPVPDAAVECAHRFLREEAVPFEFVIPATNEWQTRLGRFNTQRGRQIAAAAGIVFVLLLMVFGIRSHIEQSLASDWSGMQRSVADLDALQQKIRQFRPWFDSMPQNLETLNALVGSFPEQGDVWAKSIQISEGGKVSCAGFARNQPALMGFLDRLRGRPGITAVQVQQLRGDNPMQFAVSYKWEPKNEK